MTKLSDYIEFQFIEIHTDNNGNGKDNVVGIIVRSSKYDIKTCTDEISNIIDCINKLCNKKWLGSVPPTHLLSCDNWTGLIPLIQ